MAPMRAIPSSANCYSLRSPENGHPAIPIMKPKPNVRVTIAVFTLCSVVVVTGCFHHEHSAFRSIHQCAIDGDTAGVKAEVTLINVEVMGPLANQVPSIVVKVFV